MKKFLVALICGCFLMGSSLAFAGGNRLGVQFDSDSDFGGIYYGKDFGWAAGFSMGYDEIEGSSPGYEHSGDSFKYSIFARKNFKIIDKTYLGLGTMVAWQDGELEETVLAGDNTTTDIEEWSIAPYFIVDYHLSEHFILNAGATIANFKFMETSLDGNHHQKQDSVKYMEPFLVLTYLF